MKNISQFYESNEEVYNVAVGYECSVSWQLCVSVDNNFLFNESEGRRWTSFRSHESLLPIPFLGVSEDSGQSFLQKEGQQRRED